MAWYYEDGTPVPEEDLPDELRTYTPASRQNVPGGDPRLGRAEQPGALRDVAETLLGFNYPPYAPATAAGRKARGGLEAAQTLLTGAAAYPLGLGAGLGELLAGGSWPEAGRARREAEEAYTYAPRGPEAAEVLAPVARAMAPYEQFAKQAGRGVGMLAGKPAGDVAEEVVGTVVNPLTLVGAVGPELRAAGRAAVRGAGRGLGGVAERAAFKTLGAPAASVGNLALRGGEGAIQDVGRALLDMPGAELRQGPRGIRGTPARTGPVAQALRAAGAPLEELAATSDLRGGTVDLGAVVQKFRARTGAMEKDPFAGPRLQAVRDYLAQAAEAHGRPVSESAILPSEAWAMRQGLDSVVENASTGLRKSSPLAKELGRARALLDEELSSAMRASLGPEGAEAWTTANRRYGTLKDVERLAAQGFKRQVGRKFEPGSKWLRTRLPLGVPSPMFIASAPVGPTFRLQAGLARGADWLSKPFTF